MDRSSYLSKNLGEYRDGIEIDGRQYMKVEDLRYGTNPHQPAAFYRPAAAAATPVGGMQILKSGKSGLSQTNLEDISQAINIVKYFTRPAVAVMKHVNPSGVAEARGGEALLAVYRKARDCDARAAFGSVVAFNTEVDAETAAEIMGSFVECVVAPAFADDALELFNNGEKFALNKHIRIIRCGDLRCLPRFVGDEYDECCRTIKVLVDGSLVVAEPLLTGLRGVEDLRPASGNSSKIGEHTAATAATPGQLEDLLTAWYVNLSVRSNGVVLVKNGQTLSVGTGEQDRVGAIEQAIAKFHQKYSGDESLQGASMASDGFFPFADGLETAAAAGIAAVVAPPGSLRDAEVVKRANELGVAFYHAPERVFSHH